MSLNVLEAVALAVRADGTYAPFSGDAFRYAGEMTLLGMGMVFAVLGLLWGVLAIFKLAFVKKEKTPAKKMTEEPIAPVELSESVEAPVPEETDEKELIAVLSAAIAAYREAECGVAGGFRVVSFKRANGPRAWNRGK